MTTDAELLRSYAQGGDEAAFTALVQRHLNLVYFSALRQVGGDAHRAHDVAQAVFSDLARKATSLTDRATLTGWLHTSTRFAATKVRRADLSRQQYEQEATTMNALLHDSDPVAEWSRLRPLIDDVVHELDERDREAVLLRFFQNRPFAEIGAALRLSEDAARLRVDRALDKLRCALERRGVKSTLTALATVFANQVGATAPAGLAATITTAALASMGSAGVATAGAGFFMSSTATALASAVALAALGATFYQWNHAQRAEVELAGLMLERDSVRTQLQFEQQRSARFANDIATLRANLDSLNVKQAATAPVQRAPLPPASTTPTVDEMRRSSLNKAILDNLRLIAAATDQFGLENGRPPTSLQELVGETKYIKRLISVEGEDYSALVLGIGQPFVITNADGSTVTYEPPKAQPRRDRYETIGPSVDRAVTAYRAANNGAKPPTPQALIPFFATPAEGADFVEALAAAEAKGGK